MPTNKRLAWSVVAIIFATTAYLNTWIWKYPFNATSQSEPIWPVMLCIVTILLDLTFAAGIVVWVVRTLFVIPRNN